MKTAKLNIKKRQIKRPLFQGIASLLFVLMFTALTGFQSFAHCDSYDGPVIKDALKALKQNKVELVLKWVEPKYEKEVTAKFNQTLKLTGTNKEVNKILETHFLETLVRLHREGEGEPYTGLKPAGSMTPLIGMADHSLETKNVEGIVKAVNSHLEELLRERYAKAIELSKTKDASVEAGRAYVEAYVQYTHTLEALEHILSGPISHSGDNSHAGH
ncbi:MAG: DUF6448 family protein [Ginsengibacter sp.]|jgi:hypothetical protein